jgi:gluconokinase
VKNQPVLIICMGVSGSGKSTVASALAKQFGLEFIEADDYHSDENRARMKAGIALTDEQREPWISTLCQLLKDRRRTGNHCILAYSGLRRAHRQRFRELGFRTLFLHLAGDRELIAKRMARRAGHYMPASLLDSQIAAMEPADAEPDLVTVDVNAPLPDLTETCRSLVNDFLCEKPQMLDESIHTRQK